MIRAVIFDLDGTLAETELLKAQAYALVAQSLLGLPQPDARAVDIYKRLVGSSDETVARTMVQALKLGAVTRNPTAGHEPWQELHRLRTAAYQTKVGTPDAIRSQAYKHNIAVLHEQRQAGRLTAVATSSYQSEAERVLGALGLLGELDLVLGRDRILRPKPDPEIYMVAMSRLGVQPHEALIVEDSPVGVAAATASGAPWVCVANDFTRSALKARRYIDQMWVIYEPAKVRQVVARRIRAAESGA